MNLDDIDLDDFLAAPAPPKSTHFSMRPYQSQTIESIESGWAEHRAQLAVLSTGAGKTVVFSEVTRREVAKGHKVLILAHTDELIEQARDKFQRMSGLKAAKEKAGDYANRWDTVVVGSVQTLCRELRLKSWPVDHFGLVIVDEAHRSLADSYLKILTHFTCRVLGVTATADRGDKRALGEFYTRIAIDYGIVQAVRDGWLVRPVVQTVPLELDLRGVQTKGSTEGRDLDRQEISERIKPFLGQIAVRIRELAPTRKILCFLPSVETASDLSDAMRAVGYTSDYVSGACTDRDEKVKRYKSGELQVLCNMALLCLDLETEILTERGWLRHDQITMTDRVANWNFDGSVFFTEPLEIVHRDTVPGERMVSIDSRTINLRVTETHRMIVGCGEGRKEWKKIPAIELGRNSIPAFGIAEPTKFTQDEMPKAKEGASDKRIVSANAYCIRKSTGVSFEESVNEAKRRLRARQDLRRKLPSELTIDECKFIGFWVADGSRCNIQGGGIEYTLCQSTTYPIIVEWVDRVIASIGVDSIKRMKSSKQENAADYFVWSMPRGTGGGSQQRNGLFHLEHFLEKRGSRFIWGLNEVQFDALVEGYWMGDGKHGDGAKLPVSFKFTDTKKEWIDLLSAVGSVRNWRCSANIRPSRNPKHLDQWALNMVKRRNLTISHRTPILVETDATVPVWCVRTTSKNIITRRDGHVAVMGNTEGFDHDEIDVIVCLRPTKIRALYTQIVGRGTRPLNEIVGALNAAPDAAARRAIIKASRKPTLMLLDFLWLYEKHDLIRPASLVAKTREQAEAMGAMGDGDLLEQEERAERDLLAQLEKEVRKNSRRAAKMIDPLTSVEECCDPSLANYEPSTAPDAAPPSEPQLRLLRQNGIDVSKVKTKELASVLISRILKRHQDGLCTPRQLHFLSQLGIPNASMYTRDQAKTLITSKIASWSSRQK